LDCTARRLVDLSGIEISVKNNEKNGVKLLRNVDAAHALARFRARHDSPPLDLDACDSFAVPAHRIEARLPNRREFKSEQSDCLVLGDFSRHTEWAPRQRVVLLCKPLGSLKEIENPTWFRQ
jgi:hypothetical protein